VWSLNITKAESMYNNVAHALTARTDPLCVRLNATFAKRFDES
jgi:hypothetical protein